jgi:ABC-type uncharacterized transport system ATPase subunit
MFLYSNCCLQSVPPCLVQLQLAIPGRLQLLYVCDSIVLKLIWLLCSCCLQSLPPCLVQLQLAIPAGCLTAIVGEVGSGKSSLLAALLGELELVSGSAKLPHQQQQQQRRQQRQQQHATRVGYVGQVPWVMRGSVRDNVLMGQPYDAEFMGEVGFVTLRYNMLLFLEITCDLCWTCLSGALGDERKCERERADGATFGR